MSQNIEQFQYTRLLLFDVKMIPLLSDEIINILALDGKQKMAIQKNTSAPSLHLSSFFDKLMSQ